CFSIVPFILLVLPVSAVYMGSTNISRCPVSVPLPYQVLNLGLLGCTILAFLISYVILKALGYTYFEKPWRAIIICITILASFNFLNETKTFFKISPDFDQSSKNYCNKRFYDYVYYFNFITIVNPPNISTINGGVESLKTLGRDGE
ncbi:hypothetical protein NPIL_509001, partial [Nephila pilipes]